MGTYDTKVLRSAARMLQARSGTGEVLRNVLRQIQFQMRVQYAVGMKLWVSCGGLHQWRMISVSSAAVGNLSGLR